MIYKYLIYKPADQEKKTMTEIQQVRKGSTPLLILSILNESPRHGYAIMRELEERSEGYFTMTAALLYPTLHQMEQDHWVEAIWEGTPGLRRKKVYSITPQGKEQLSQGHQEWKRFFEQLFRIVEQPKSMRSTQ
ncbi:MAG: PadR family transcriptional regulator [Bacteroidales bacterium]